MGPREGRKRPGSTVGSALEQELSEQAREDDVHDRADAGSARGAEDGVKEEGDGDLDVGEEDVEEDDDARLGEEEHLDLETGAEDPDEELEGEVDDEVVAVVDAADWEIITCEMTGFWNGF